jgi:hypothetical protein
VQCATSAHQLFPQVLDLKRFVGKSVIVKLTGASDRLLELTSF